jgi:hypothetical protein
MPRTSRTSPARLAGIATSWFALLGPAAATAATVTRGPYLQQVGGTNAMVVWRTSAAVACTLGYAVPGQGGSTVVTPAGIEHLVALNGLQPGTRYEYTIRAAGLLAGGPDHCIRTAPPPGTGASHRLLVWGDSGFGNATQMAVAAAMNAQDADLALVVGDIIQTSGEAKYYDPRFFQPYAPLLRRTPAWGVLGNHDMGEPSAFYNAWFLPTNPIDGTERFYSFDFGDLHVVGLDTNQPMTAATLDWLAADLAATARRWKMVFFHHTVYSCGSYHGSTESWIRILGPVFEAHGVDVSFNGHDHHFERSYPMVDRQAVGTEMDPDYLDPAGPIYVISGAAGSPRAASESCAHTARAIGMTPCFVRVEVSGDRLVLEAIDVHGAVLDRMTVRKSGGPPPPPPPATLAITAPTGGETFDIGAPVTIRWTASPSLAAIRIELSRTSASGPWETLAGAALNAGQWTWIATAPAAPGCWLRLSDAGDGDPSACTVASFGIRAEAGEPPAPPSVIGINFQPSTSFVPVAYVDDIGRPYDPGEGFGWTADMAMVARNIHPEDPRDTFVDVVNSQPARWEIDLPNGHYRVAFLCGDYVTTATHRVALEGQVVIQDVPTIAGQFFERGNIPVQVTDGRLTMTVGGGFEITHTKVNAIVIASGAAEPHTWISPAGGENYCTGGSVALGWTGATAGSHVWLELSRSGPSGPWETIGMTPDDGEELWAVSAPPAADCFVRIADLQGEVLAQSTLPFGISAPYITLVRPNGGETWTTGSVRNFEWTTSCLAGWVRIDTSRQGRLGPWTTLVPSSPNDGVETWHVRLQDVGWTHVRVVALPFGLPADQNDAPFAVVEEAQRPPALWRFDFLPAEGTPAGGYLADTGLQFAADRGHGWTSAVLMKQRELLPGDCRDTFVQVTNNTSRTWELAVPDGSYLVALTCGDPFTSGTHRVALEGRIVVDDVYANGGTYVSRVDLPVEVDDGRLTMTLGGNGQITSTKVSCIEVLGFAPVRPQPRGRPRDVAPAVEPALGDRLEVASLARGPVAITLLLRQPAPVELEILDVRGRSLAVLHDGPLGSGRHAFAWDPRGRDGRTLPSGVYFVRAESPALHTTRKLVWLR